MTTDRTPPKKKAKELAKYFRAERPDYPYLKSVFRALREELEIQVPKTAVQLPEIPTEEKCATSTKLSGIVEISRI